METVDLEHLHEHNCGFDLGRLPIRDCEICADLAEQQPTRNGCNCSADLFRRASTSWIDNIIEHVRGCHPWLLSRNGHGSAR